jgi:hypothetical protein
MSAIAFPASTLAPPIISDTPIVAPSLVYLNSANGTTIVFVRKDMVEIIPK